MTAFDPCADPSRLSDCQPLSYLTTIIVFYHQPERLYRCLRSLDPAAHQGLRVILIDNSTRLDSDLPNRFPYVHLITSERNLGFAAACNLGFKQVWTPYVLFLNPDTEVEGPVLEAMVEHLNSHPPVKLVTIRLHSRCGPDVQQVASFPSLVGKIRSLDELRISARTSHSWRIKEGWVKGAVMAMRATDFSALGGFDERFFLYGEDLELCYRIRLGGGDIHLLDQGHVFHAGNERWPLQRRIQVGAAVLQFCALHRSTWLYCLAVLGFLVRLVPWWVASWFDGTGGRASTAMIIGAVYRSRTGLTR